MPANLTLSAGTLYAFLLVLARVAAPWLSCRCPGSAPRRTGHGGALRSDSPWPCRPLARVEAECVTAATLAGWAAAEAAIGIAIGVSVAIVLEAFALAAQVLGLQAGYAYASTIDPNTQADSGILLVLAQLLARHAVLRPGAGPRRSCGCSPRAWTAFPRGPTCSARAPRKP